MWLIDGAGANTEAFLHSYSFCTYAKSLKRFTEVDIRKTRKVRKMTLGGKIIQDYH